MSAGAPARPAAPTGRADWDARVEAATGMDIELLHRDAEHEVGGVGRLIRAHRALRDAERAADYHRSVLHRLSGDHLTVDDALVARIHRTADQLADAARQREVRVAELLDALIPVEEQARSARGLALVELSSPDLAALTAIAAGGAVLREHLVTHRLSAMTADGTRVTWAALQRLEAHGLTTRDGTRPLHVGQPVTLTDAGRAVLDQARHTRRSTPPATVERSPIALAATRLLSAPSTPRR